MHISFRLHSLIVGLASCCRASIQSLFSGSVHSASTLYGLRTPQHCELSIQSNLLPHSCFPMERFHGLLMQREYVLLYPSKHGSSCSVLYRTVRHPLRAFSHQASLHRIASTGLASQVAQIAPCNPLTAMKENLYDTCTVSPDLCVPTVRFLPSGKERSVIVMRFCRRLF